MEEQQLQVEDLLCDDSFIHYCYGSNEADVQKWEQYIQQNPGQAHTLQTAKDILLAVSIRFTNEQLDQRLASFKQMFDANKPAPSIEAPVVPISTPKKSRTIWYAAASVAILVTAGLLMLQRKNNTSQQALVFESNTDQRKEVELADGTKVTLYPHSRLTVAGHYNDTHRDVQLEGQAYFDVAQVAGKPFAVKTNKFTTTALGTAFMVRAYTVAAASLKVSLVSGKVKVEASQKELLANPVILSPGEQFDENLRTHKVQKVSFDINTIQQVQTGVLVFKNASVKEVIDKLEAYYGVSIECSIPPENVKRFTGEFHQESLSHVLNVFSFVTNLNVQHTATGFYQLK
ncbi:FecR family protein [Chitinophaga skermanii]|uniref:FecR family protein n=1 Tax=Chitinophaga skermanii TaxID=331697 RepID=A0A327QRW7_9BACT|nr:FecR family protein [Chitinophaga skermanii]RAJ06645.1 FecR family protein [Chitinophaga skermanii]